MMNNRWLIISYFANLKGACQSEWIEDRMAALSQHGVWPVLLSSMCGAKHVDIPHYRVLSLFPADIKYELDFILRRQQLGEAVFRFLRTLVFLPLYPFYLIETKVLNIYGESRWSWLPAAVVSGLYSVYKYKPSVIYTTGGPASAHIVGVVLSRISGIPLVSELQDPLVGPDIGRNAISKKGLGYIEKVIFNNSKKVIFCTRAASESATLRQHSDKAVCVYPGSFISAVDRLNPHKGKVMKFVYLGSLYQTRNLDRFMDAVSMLFSEMPEAKGEISVEVYGNMNADIRQRILSFPHKVITLHGLIPREEAMRKAFEADVLLLVQNTDSRSSVTIPFKTYDYLLSGKKILGLIHKNPELSAMLESHGHMSIPADDEMEIKRALATLVSEWRLSKLSDGVVVSDITVDRAARQMVELVAPMLK